MFRISQAASFLLRLPVLNWSGFPSWDALNLLFTPQEKYSCEQLVHYGKLLHQNGFVSATDGNLSVRLDAQRIIATPTGMGKGTMRVRDMVLVDNAGTRLKGRRNASSEMGMHLSIYRLRPDVNAVVHAHPCTATAFACTDIPLDEPLCSEMVLTLGMVPLAPYGTTGTAELSESLLPFIPKANAILMANHGVVSYGRNLCEAYQRMEAVEHLARVVLASRQVGKRALLDDAKIQKLLNAKDSYSASA